MYTGTPFVGLNFLPIHLNNPLLIRGQKMKVIYCYMSNEALIIPYQLINQKIAKQLSRQIQTVYILHDLGLPSL